MRAARKPSGECDMHDTLQNLFRYKAWANDKLLTALAGAGGRTSVTRAIVNALLAGFGGGSLARLAVKALNHSHIVDRIFAAHMRRQAHAYPSVNSSELPTLEDLSASIRKSDREYVDYVCALDREQLVERIDFTFTDGAPGRMSREEMLMHVINHGTYHRGQIGVLMMVMGAPSLKDGSLKDGFTTHLHEAQASARGR
jgi:uncharacterized damage-inducible protein DinB